MHIGERGFTLLEIMVVVAIISIMATSVVVGFGSFGRTVRLQETIGAISDIVSNLALDMTRREYQAQLIHFGQDYIIVEAKPGSEGLSLRWNGQGACGPGEEELEVDNSGFVAAAFLAKRDSSGNSIGITAISPDTVKSLCEDPLSAGATEDRYQAFSGGRVSQTIRFIRFDLRPDNPDPVRITGGNDVTVELRGPYAVKKFLKDGVPSADRVELTLESDGAAETVVLRE